MASPVSDEGWDLVVPPEGEEALLAELHRHGVRPGQRWHLTLVSSSETVEAPPEQPWRRSVTPSDQGEAAPAADADDFDRLTSSYRFRSGDPTLARRAKEIARVELGKP